MTKQVQARISGRVQGVGYPLLRGPCRQRTRASSARCVTARMAAWRQSPKPKKPRSTSS